MGTSYIRAALHQTLSACTQPLPFLRFIGGSFETPRHVQSAALRKRLIRTPSGCYVASGSPIAARTASMLEAGAPPAAAQKRGFGRLSSKR